MNLFKSKISKRLAISKIIWFIIGLLAFFMVPFVFVDADMYIRLGLLFWYTTFGVIIWFVWYMDKHPVFTSLKMPWWFRWAFMWAWLNFVLALFMYHTLWDLMVWTMFEGCSPFIVVLEWLILGFIIDWLATKCAWDGKELCD